MTDGRVAGAGFAMPCHPLHNESVTGGNKHMSSIPGRVYVLFVVSVAFQLAAMFVLPRTRGFTAPLPTLLCAVLFICGIGAVARMSVGRSSGS